MYCRTVARRGASEAYRYPLVVAVASRVGVYALLATVPSHRIASTLGRYDASWYRWMALHGYDRGGAHGHHADVAAFSPLFPAAYRVASVLPGPMSVWGSLLSSCLFAAGLCLLHSLTRIELDSPTADRTVLYLAIFPMTFVFSLPYSESLFLVLTVACFALCTADRGWAAGAAAAGMVLTRPVGIAIIPALAWRAHARRTGWRGAAPALLPTVAQIALVTYLAWHTGDPLAQLHAQQHGWHRSLSSPPAVLAHTIWVELIQAHHARAAIDVSFMSLWLALFVHCVRLHFPGEYLVFVALAILIPIAGGLIISAGRFGLVAFPLFWALADMGRRPMANRAVLLLSPALLAALVYLTYGPRGIAP